MPEPNPQIHPPTAPPPELLRLAADHATAHVPVAAPGDTAGAVRSKLAGQHYECADDVAVLSGDRLVGILPIERLLAASADTPVGDIMDGDPPFVSSDAPEEAVAWKMVRHGESSMPVVDADGGFLGLIPPHTMLEVLLAAHDEDLARIGGYTTGTRRARLAAEEDVRHRLVHRLPWILIGLAGAMVSALLVGAFEDELADNVLLAFFVPAVVYMADAVGTQTEALLIRGLAVGVSIRSVVRRELLTGLAMGLIVGAAFFPFALLLWGDAGVALGVALSLLASCSMATMVAMVLPWLFQRLGRDPAFGSGPLATVIQDLLSIGVYFAIAVPLAT